MLFLRRLRSVSLFKLLLAAAAAAAVIAVVIYLIVMYFKSPTSYITSEYFNRLNQEEKDKIINYFRPLITNQQKNRFRNTLRALVDAIRFNVTFFMYSGTLLGSYAHHDMIPWDDDMDLIVKADHRDILRKRLETLKPDYELYTVAGGGDLWKFYHKNISQTQFPWSYPFIDILFYKEDATYVWDIDPFGAKPPYRREDIYPLIQRPFMGMMINAPRHTASVLSNYYDINICKTRFYDKILVKPINITDVIAIPCDVLRDSFTFVTRTQFNDTHVIETLQKTDTETKQISTSTFISLK